MKGIIAFASTLVLAGIACLGGGVKDLSGCLKASVDSFETVFSSVHVYGTIWNTCSEEVSYARVGALCYDRAELVIGSDTEYVEDLPPGASVAFDAIVPDRTRATTKCSVIVIGAR